MKPHTLPKNPNHPNLRRMIALVIMTLLSAIGCCAKPITTTMLLKPLKSGEPWDRGVLTSTKTVLFNQTASGGTNANLITVTQLGFFTSTNCSGSLAGTGFYVTPNNSPSFTTVIGTPFGLTAVATWKVGTTQLGMSSGTMSTIQSIAMTFKTTASGGIHPQSNFSGSSFACIEGVSCASGSCTSSSSTQNFTLKTTASIGDPADGGVIACMNGGLNNLVAPTTDNSTGLQWGGSGTTTSATSITDGSSNTTIIVTALGSSSNYAAITCSTYAATGGYTSGWFLPSGNNTSTSGQQACLCTNQSTIGGFAAAPYWSSTERTSTEAYNEVFNTCVQNAGANKVDLDHVRCVRALTL